MASIAQQWKQINQPERELSRPPLRHAVPPSPGGNAAFLSRFRFRFRAAIKKSSGRSAKTVVE